MRAAAGDEAADALIAEGMALPLADVVAAAETLHVGEVTQETIQSAQFSLMVRLSSIE